MLQNPCKTLGINKYGLQNSPSGEVNHIQPVAYYLPSLVPPLPIIIPIEVRICCANGADIVGE